VKKDFKIARRPGASQAAAAGEVSPAKPVSRPAAPDVPARQGDPSDEGRTTRKTIEVPEEYFVMVKVRAAKRRLREKDVWAEILREYFAAHPED
jgi:hypothetical protein